MRRKKEEERKSKREKPYLKLSKKEGRKSRRKNSARTAKYTVDGDARGMREVFRSVSWPPRFWA